MHTDFPRTHLTRAAIALDAQRRRDFEQAELLPDGDMRDHFLAEAARAERVAEDFRRAVAAEDAADREAIRQSCYGQG